MVLGKLDIYVEGNGTRPVSLIFCPICKSTEKKKTSQCVDIGKNFLNRTPVTKERLSTIDKWDFMKLKVLCIKRNNQVKRWGCLPTWRKPMLAASPPDDQYIDYTNSSKLNTKLSNPVITND